MISSSHMCVRLFHFFVERGLQKYRAVLTSGDRTFLNRNCRWKRSLGLGFLTTIPPDVLEEHSQIYQEEKWGVEKSSGSAISKQCFWDRAEENPQAGRHIQRSATAVLICLLTVLFHVLQGRNVYVLSH